MWLVVGLGNPGPKYALNRHNIGFMMVDQFVEANGRPTERSEKKALTYHLTLHDDSSGNSEKIIFCKPQTFMNLSGDAVRPLCDFYKIPPKNVIVAHDEVDLPYTRLRVQHTRGHGGQNGIRDIHQKLGTNEYYRLRLGVGRPPNDKWDLGDYVLSNFKNDEQKELGDFLNRSLDALETLIFKGYDKASTEFNAK